MNPKELSDEQCWKIWSVIEPDPEEQYLPTRQMVFDYVRSWLEGGPLIVRPLEALSLHLREKDEGELAAWIERLAEAYRKRN